MNITKEKAHALPYAKHYFDAAISIDSFTYYGTSDTYLQYFASFMKARCADRCGQPGTDPGFQNGVPDYLTEPDENGNAFRDPKECWSFHTSQWWREHWQHTGLVDIGHDADMVRLGSLAQVRGSVPCTCGNGCAGQVVRMSLEFSFLGAGHACERDDRRS